MSGNLSMDNCDFNLLDKYLDPEMFLFLGFSIDDVLGGQETFQRRPLTNPSGAPQITQRSSDELYIPLGKLWCLLNHRLTVGLRQYGHQS